MPTPDPTDAELVALACRQDESAFGALMRRYSQPLFSFTWQLLGNSTDAREITQDTFVKAWQNLHRFDPDRKFSTWLFALARHAAIDRLRWRQRQRTEPLPPELPLPAADSVTAELQDRELAQQIATAIQALPEDQRTALVLAEYQGLGQTEIAQVLGCTVKSVESRLYRARQHLRRHLARWL